MMRALATRGMELLEDIASGAAPRAHLGQSSSTAGSWERLAGVYFGPTRQKKLQAAAVTAGRGLPVAAIERIEKHLRKLSRKAAVSEWELRVELCGLRGTVDEIDREAAARVYAHNRQVPGTDNRGLRAWRRKNVDAWGMSTATLTLPPATWLLRRTCTADKLRRRTCRLDAGDGRRHQHGVGGGQPATRRPGAPGVMRAPDYVPTPGEGGDPVPAHDGTTITGREWPRRASLNSYVDLRPCEAASTCTGSSPTTNNGCLKAETVCPYLRHPPADECQFHHHRLGVRGGDELANMTAACRCTTAERR